MPDAWSDRRDALPQGRVLRDYTIEEVLGHGGFGIVYKARHNELDHVVAIKEYLPSELAVREGATIRAKSAESEAHFADGLRRFREEAKALIEFQQHPSIVDCREFFRANGTAYLVMEYVEGLPLSQLLRRRETAGKPFTESDLLSIAVPLAQGLAHIHRAGVIHRDIKPANILVRSSDQQPVLVDFGASKQAVAEHSRSLAPYTEGYAALEQVADGQLGPWTDLYGFGAVLWRMVAGGNPPWHPPNPVKAETRANARVREADDPLPTATELGAGRFSNQLLEVIDGCLQLRDTERIRESDRVLQMLEGSGDQNHQTATAEQHLKGGPAVDLPDPVNDEAGTGPSSSRRLRKIVGLAAAVTAAFALVMVVLVPRNHVLAAKYSAIACSGGIVASCSDLGTAYRTGDGVPRDDFRAADLYEQACEGGFAEGCVRLGGLYIEGEGVPQDASRAAELFERGCEASNSMGCWALAGMYYAGNGVSEDRARAADLFERVERACDRGDAESCSAVGLAYDKGIAVTKDRARATEFFRHACAGGDADGCLGLGGAYRDGVGVGEDKARAVELFHQACDMGSSGGCVMSGSAYFDGGFGVGQDLMRAAEYFERACDGRNSSGCAFLGALHIKGKGVSKDIARGIELLGRACDRGNALACSLLGAAYRDGDEVDKDEARARVYFERACKKGEFNACLQACDGDLDCVLSMAEEPE